MSLGGCVNLSEKRNFSVSAIAQVEYPTGKIILLQCTEGQTRIIKVVFY